MGAVILTNGEGESGMSAAISALESRQCALDIVEAGIKIVERNVSINTVGLGGIPDMLGQVACDAAIMEGRSLRAGAVGDLKGFVHSISVARQIMERLPHVMLVGDGAARFASEIGLTRENLLTKSANLSYKNWISDSLPRGDLSNWPTTELTNYAWLSADPATAKGTVIFLVRDNQGNLAGGVSSSGWAYKYPGRIGDSCVIGAGLYVDNRYGAAACTHTGEMTIRAGTARAVVSALRYGASIKEACHTALDDLRHLDGGYIGPVVMHAMNCSGECYVLSTGSDGNVSYYLWSEEAGVTARQGPNVGSL